MKLGIHIFSQGLGERRLEGDKKKSIIFGKDKPFTENSPPVWPWRMLRMSKIRDEKEAVSSHASLRRRKSWDRALYGRQTRRISRLKIIWSFFFSTRTKILYLVSKKIKRRRERPVSSPQWVHRDSYPATFFWNFWQLWECENEL